jgi:ferritin
VEKKKKKEIVDALNKHLNREIASSYLYFSMATDCHERDLPGCAHWMEVQGQEELHHVKGFYHYLIRRGQRIVLTAIAQPQHAWPSLKAIFDAALAHEKQVTDEINALVSMARSHKDYATEQFLQWFVEEQVEEEANVIAVINQLERAKDSATSLLWLDNQLSLRKLVQQYQQ